MQCIYLYNINNNIHVSEYNFKILKRKFNAMHYTYYLLMLLSFMMSF